MPKAGGIFLKTRKKVVDGYGILGYNPLWSIIMYCCGLLAAEHRELL
jgi:hypothetical protein